MTTQTATPSPTITGATELLALIGDPLSKAKTPELIAPLLISDRYQGRVVLVPLRVAEGRLASAVKGLAEMQNVRGAIVTMPHKKAMFQLLDHATEEATLVQACNVIRFGPNRELFGTMLDGQGFVEGLQNQGVEVEGRRVLLLGAGGAAVGIAHALIRIPGVKLSVWNRTMERAQTLVAALPSDCSATASAAPAAANYDLIINATSLGMKEGDALPIDLNQLSSTCVVCDVVVTEEFTPFLTHAQVLGARVHAGKHMLIAQLQLMLNFMLDLEPDGYE